MARLLLLPGLGADKRLFAGLGGLCLPVIVRRLPEPVRHEGMTTYALRVAAQLQMRPDDWIGGVSFGGMVAAAIARHRPARGLILIGGALSSDALPRALRIATRLARYVPIAPVRAALGRPFLLMRGFGLLTAAQAATIATMLAATPENALREGARLLANHHPAIPLLCPAYAIHGAQDRLMHAPPVADCQQIADAGHGLVLTHAHAVTAFLEGLLCHTTEIEI